MPELPEVEAVVRGLRDDGLEGARLKAARVLRPLVTRPQSPDEVEHLSTGVTVRAVRRRAKNVLIDLSNDHTLRIHLRMTGDLAIQPGSAERSKLVRAEWQLTRGRLLVFSDMRALGRVHIYSSEELEAILAKLGPEPLDRSFTSARLVKTAQTSRLPAKLFLMDQTKVAGLGNIYAAEALFRARISPFRNISSVSTKDLEQLRTAIQDTLRSAVHSIYKAYRSPGGYRKHRDGFQRYVYGRAGEPCFRCGRPIQKMEQGGRSTYFCAHCQR
jgi:formamidopyrimidine-DNA glycosylase